MKRQLSSRAHPTAWAWRRVSRRRAREPWWGRGWRRRRSCWRWCSPANASTCSGRAGWRWGRGTWWPRWWRSAPGPSAKRGAADEDGRQTKRRKITEGFSIQFGQMVSISKYLGTTQYWYQTFKVLRYWLMTSWFIFNVIPGYSLNFLYGDCDYFFRKLIGSFSLSKLDLQCEYRDRVSNTIPVSYGNNIFCGDYETKDFYFLFFSSNFMQRAICSPNKSMSADRGTQAAVRETERVHRDHWPSSQWQRLRRLSGGCGLGRQKTAPWFPSPGSSPSWDRETRTRAAAAPEQQTLWLFYFFNVPEQKSLWLFYFYFFSRS